MDFFTPAATLITKLTISLTTKSLVTVIDDVKTKRRMQRLVDDAVDRIVEQTEEYLRKSGVGDAEMEIIITEIGAKLEPLVEEPQKLFAGNLDGTLIFDQCHPKGELPQAIREEDLGQFYSVLFPRIAHFLAGSRVALAEWQAEGYREEFKRLSQIASEIAEVGAKVGDLPAAVISAQASEVDRKAEKLLHEFAQVLLSNLLLRLDLSPLRAERALHGALADHFVLPAFCERRENAKPIEIESDLLTVFAKPRTLRIVHGGAGVGKTTWSLWMQSRLLQGNTKRLAVVIRLRKVTDIESRSLLDLLRTQAGTQLRDALTDEMLRNWYDTGRLVVILDGFDEVSEDRRDNVEQWVRELSVAVGNSTLIVTSRPLQSGHLEGLKDSWQQWDLLPFDEPRILDFIERWHRYLPEGELSDADRNVDASVLANTFFSDPSLKTLSDTPLMLGTLLFVHHRDKKLPSGRVDLYERYISAMLGLRDSGLGIEARATKLTDKEKRRVLANIGLHFHLTSVNEVNDDTMHKLVSEALELFQFDEEPERLLAALCERTGLLQGPGAWSFMHKTIGEFLVAELICDGVTVLEDKRRLDRKELWSHRNEDTWTAVLFFWAGKNSPRELEEFIADLLREGSTDSTLLALSLLHDQGDRITHETRRALSLQMLKELPLALAPANTYGYSCCITVTCPAFAYRESIRTKNIQLRGLTMVDSTIALKHLFDHGALVPEDIRNFDEDHRDMILIPALWALKPAGTSISFEIRHHLEHMPSRDVALYCFNYSFINMHRDSTENVQQHKAWLEGWLAAFPEGRPWVPLLLAGHLVSPRANGRKAQGLAALLWQWRNEPIAEEWLLGSFESKGWPPGFEVFDLIDRTLQELGEDGADDWGLSVEQHADLLAWCDDKMAERTQLKAAAQDQ